MITTTIIPLNDGITFFIDSTRPSDDDGRPRELTMKASITDKIPLAVILDHIENILLGRIHDGWWELENRSSQMETWKYHPHNHEIF